jgi:hypothetical protein
VFDIHCTLYNVHCTLHTTTDYIQPAERRASTRSRVSPTRHDRLSSLPYPVPGPYRTGTMKGGTEPGWGGRVPLTKDRYFSLITKTEIERGKFKYADNFCPEVIQNFYFYLSIYLNSAFSEIPLPFYQFDLL